MKISRIREYKIDCEEIQESIALGEFMRFTLNARRSFQGEGHLWIVSDFLK